MAPHNQVRPLHHPDRLRSRAVVGGVGLPGHRVHARPVVVPPGARRRRQFHRVTAAPRSGKPGNGDRLQRRVRRRDGRVRRLVVPQRRRRSGSFAIVPNRRRQGELSSSDRADVAHSWRRHHQVRMAFRLRRSLRYRHLHRCRAVVRGVRFIPHRVHARTVIVRPRARRRCQLLRLAAALRCGKLRHRVHAHLGVRRRDRRVRRPVVPQGRRRSISLTFVPNRRRQRERRPSRGAAIAHRWRRHHQVRMAFRLQLSLVNVVPAAGAPVLADGDDTIRSGTSRAPSGSTAALQLASPAKTIAASASPATAFKPCEPMVIPIPARTRFRLTPAVPTDRRERSAGGVVRVGFVAPIKGSVKWLSYFL